MQTFCYESNSFAKKSAQVCYYLKEDNLWLLTLSNLNSYQHPKVARELSIIHHYEVIRPNILMGNGLI